MEKEKLSNVIDYKKHIVPYRLIELVSGVGSGKNYWVENILMKKQRVLLITSRKSKVEETIERVGVDNCLNLSIREQKTIMYLFENDTRYGSCICNPWQIEYYMKDKYISGDYRTYLWNFFDIIVVDEAHSLATDAIFCNAPFYLLDFIKAACRQSNKKIILMTATYEPIKNLIIEKNSKNYAFWDFTEQCENIIPSKLEYMTRETALKSILQKYKRDPNGKWHAVYFATKTKHIKNNIVPYLIEEGIPEENIAVSFSSVEAEEGFSDILLQNKTRTENYLKTHEDIPDDIKVFITTSRNKEGINIKNDEFIWNIIIESHWIDEIQQMWGRVRSPINRFMLVYDASQHQAITVDQDFDFAFDVNAVKLTNAIFDKWCEKHDIPPKNRYQNKEAAEKIEMLQEQRFPYLRYSAYDDKFHLYRGKILGLKNFDESVKYFERHVREWLGEQYDNENLRSPFPIESVLYTTSSKKERFEAYAKGKGYFDRPISKEERTDLLNFVNKDLRLRQKKNKSKPYTDLSKAIKEFGWKISECSKHRGTELYGCYRLETITPITSGGDLESAI